MATRATYKFHNTQLITYATVYIHWDGYPKGAAQYIADAIGYQGGSYSETATLTIERFIRANEGANVTEGHSAHGDTDYRYDFRSKEQMTVSRRTIEKVGDDYEERWNQIFSGSIEEFLNDNYTTEEHKQ